VVGQDGGGPVGAACGVLVEGAGPPDVLAGAVDLGVVDGRDVVTVPGAAGGVLDQTGQAAGDGVGTPGPVLGEGLHRLPVGGPLDGQGGLGDGVLLDVEGQGGDPLGEATMAGSGEGPGEGLERCLPDGPEQRSVSH